MSEISDVPTTADDIDHPGVRVKAHPGLCRGWGNCHRFGPQVYSLDEEGQIDIHLLDVPADLALEAVIGASACPEQAITVIGPPEEYWLRRLRAAQDAARAAATAAAPEAAP